MSATSMASSAAGVGVALDGFGIGCRQARRPVRESDSVRMVCMGVLGEVDEPGDANCVCAGTKRKRALWLPVGDGRRGPEAGTFWAY